MQESFFKCSCSIKAKVMPPGGEIEKLYTGLIINPLKKNVLTHYN